jgi:hypothetical protein
VVGRLRRLLAGGFDQGEYGSKRGGSTAGFAAGTVLPLVAATPKSRPQPPQYLALLVRCRPHFGQKFMRMPYLFRR